MIVYIYDLSDPRSGEVRYVGKSVRPRERFAEHVRQARKGNAVHCRRWIDGLLQAGMRPVLGILEEVEAHQADDAERFWIAALRLAGFALTNLTPGGDGQPAGYQPGPEALAKLHAATRGRKATPEQRERLRAAFTRPEVRARRRELLLERYADPVKRAAITGPTRGTKLSPETKKRMSDAWTPERKAAHAAQKAALPVDERWRAQLAAGRKKRWDDYRAARDI